MSRQRNQLGRFDQESTCFDKPCERCGTVFRRWGSKRRFCSQKCYRNVTRYIDKRGYVVVKVPGHPHATTNGWVREHVVVACAKLGRSLLPTETVHHKDENKQNNHPDNLEVLTRSAHTRTHVGNPNNRKEGEPNSLVMCECGCGGTLQKYDRKGRPRRLIYGHQPKRN